MKTYTFIGPRLQANGPIGGFGEESTNLNQKNIIAQINKIVESQSNDLVFSTGLAPGIEQWAAIAALKHRKPYIVYLPYENMDGPWPAKSKALYKQLLDGATSIEYVNRGEYSLDKLRAKEDRLLGANVVYSFYTVLPRYISIDTNKTTLINGIQNSKATAQNKDEGHSEGYYLEL